jgi:subtilisin family serine protease
MNMNFFIPSPTKPRIVPTAMFTAFDLEVDTLLGVRRARNSFQVDGTGLSAAVLDTGIRITHKCFVGQITEVRNFTEESGSNPTDVTDFNGHGTNVAGLIAAATSDERRGIAPGAKLIPIKVLPAASMEPILSALKWILDNAGRLNITVVNMSLGVPGVNFRDDSAVRQVYSELHTLLAQLNANRIAVVVAAGNDYYQFQQEGMSVPAIFREVISVGAVYDASVGRREYLSGAVAETTRADQFTPFSQRLSVELSAECFTDVFSAGGGATSAGATDDNATSVQDGTSQAAPTVAGVVLLLQQHYKRLTGNLPPVSLLQQVLRSTSTWLADVETASDNVKNSGRSYPRVNAFESLAALDLHVKLNGAT